MSVSSEVVSPGEAMVNVCTSRMSPFAKTTRSEKMFQSQFKLVTKRIWHLQTVCSNHLLVTALCIALSTFLAGSQTSWNQSFSTWGTFHEYRQVS
jgi:hypothetical protein